MKKFNTIFAKLFALCLLISWLFSGTAFAAGGADYGRGAETDPVASALVSALTTNLNGANITSGNIALARIAAALATSSLNGTNITAGDIALARIATALTTCSLSGTNVTSGDIALARIATALTTSSLNGTNITAGDIALARITAALTASSLNASNITAGTFPAAVLLNSTNLVGVGPTVFTGSYTNSPSLTNIVVVTNGVTVSVTPQL